MERRSFLKRFGTAVAALAVAPKALLAKPEPKPLPRPDPQLGHRRASSEGRQTATAAHREQAQMVREMERMGRAARENLDKMVLESITGRKWR